MNRFVRMLWPQGQVQRSMWIISTVLVSTIVALFILDRTFMDAARGKDLAGILQAVVTVVAIAGGGIFAYYKLQIFRVFAPHLTISQEVSHRYIGDRYVHISVTATLHNSSKVKIELRKGFFLLQQISPMPDEEVDSLHAEVFKEEKYEHIQWPTIEETDREFGPGDLIVEPGESHPEPFEFILPRHYESVMIYTYFYNPISSHPEGWAASKVYDITDT